jgi:hypothetical protein
VAAFFEAHPDFELGLHKLQPFLKASGAEPKGIRPEVIADVEKLQRMFRLTGDYRKTEGLITAGYRASADIVAAGRSRFVTEARRTAGMSTSEATMTFEAAANLNLAAVIVATNLRTLTWPAALEGESARLYSKQIERIVAEQPDLKSLFGSTDVCACRHCRSIYGPAAYFADVMRFLRNRMVRDTSEPQDNQIQALLASIRLGLAGTTTEQQAFDVAKTRLATFLGLPVSDSAKVLRDVRMWSPDGQTTLATLLTSGRIANASVPLSPDSTPELYRAIRGAKREADLLLGRNTKTAKEVLFARRPDLGEIDLNCENAEVPVPHIDIVCELLEEAVAPDPGFGFNGSVAAGKATEGILAAIRAQGPGCEVSDAAVIYGPYTGSRFMLRDKGIAVAVDGPAPNWKLRRLRQTHGSPEERAASPEYVNTAAYDALATGKAAFDLPFDLCHAETRAFLGAAGVERADLMRALEVGALERRCHRR